MVDKVQPQLRRIMATRLFMYLGKLSDQSVK